VDNPGRASAIREEEHAGSTDLQGCGRGAAASSLDSGGDNRIYFQ